MRDEAVTTSGVLYPAQLPIFHREPATGATSVFVRWFWIPECDLEPCQISRQHLIAFTPCTLVVEQNITGISGPTTRASFRDLTVTAICRAHVLTPFTW